MQQSRRRIWLATSLLLVTARTAGCGGGGDGADSSASPPGPASPAPGPSSGTPTAAPGPASPSATPAPTAAPGAPVPTPPPAAPVPTPPAPPPPSGPFLGAHALAYTRLGDAVPVLTTTAMETSATGSVLLACVGRGDSSVTAPPADSRGNVFAMLGSAHDYALWPGSGTALYACAPASGGSSHVVSASKPPTDEVTLSVVEVRRASLVRDVRWVEVRAGQPLKSASVTTTGPAVLVAWWWGDASGAFDKTAVPDNGFSVINSILLEGWLVQCAVAVRQVDAAGTYSVTWTSTPTQGAQLWIAAVQ